MGAAERCPQARLVGPSPGGLAVGKPGRSSGVVVGILEREAFPVRHHHVHQFAVVRDDVVRLPVQTDI